MSVSAGFVVQRLGVGFLCSGGVSGVDGAGEGVHGPLQGVIAMGFGLGLVGCADAAQGQRVQGSWWPAGTGFRVESGCRVQGGQRVLPRCRACAGHCMFLLALPLRPCCTHCNRVAPIFQVLSEAKAQAAGGLMIKGLAVSHVAHLGGALAGVLLVLLVRMLPEGE